MATSFPGPSVHQTNLGTRLVMLGKSGLAYIFLKINRNLLKINAKLLNMNDKVLNTNDNL